MPTVTTIVTIAPNFFDAHYWLFGIIVIMAVTALIDGILVERTDTAIGSNTFILSTLFGAFLGSVVALVMNIIPWIVSVGLFGLLILYVWRSGFD